MKKLAVLAFTLATAASVMTAPLAYAAGAREQGVVDESADVIAHLRHGHDDVARQARDLLHQARAVLIIPHLAKGGFIFGGQGGSGVLVARTAPGSWSDPAFYSMGAGSFGLQIGFEVSRVVLIVMNDHALHALMHDKVKLGAEAGLALATIGAGGEASTTTHGGADIYVIAESKGLFGGVAIEGGAVGARHSWDTDYYGSPVTSSDIVLRRAVSNPGAGRLQQALSAF